MVVPRFFDRCRYPAAAGCCSLERTSRTKVEANWQQPLALSSQALPVDPALFLSAARGPVRPHLRPNPRLNAPTRHIVWAVRPVLGLGRFRPVFGTRRPLNSGQTSPSSAASTGWRSGCSGTHLGATGGTQNTLAPNRNKARQLRCTRQGLVRVPLSNTKYGGNDGKTGGDRTPVMEASISESSGIPKRKNLPQPCGMKPSPAVHRASIYSLSGIALQRLTYGYGKFGLACP